MTESEINQNMPQYCLLDEKIIYVMLHLPCL